MRAVSRLSRFHDAERDDATGEETMAAGGGWNVSAAARARMQMVTEFVKTSTEARRGVMVLKAAHRSVSSFDPAMILLDPII
jgi:hypothetical protein